MLVSVVLLQSDLLLSVISPHLDLSLSVLLLQCDLFLPILLLQSDLFLCWGVLLLLHIGRQGPAVLAAGAWVGYIFSSPEPSGSQGELIVYPYSGVRCRCRRRQQCLNIFSSETALPIKLIIKAKFYVEPPWEGGTKVCINGSGHMTKMAAMLIYGKNL